MVRTSVPRAVVAFAIALGAGVVTALIQCSDDEGMTEEGWNPGLALIFAGVVVATLLAHRWWPLWVVVTLAPPWVSLVDCVANDPTSDGLEILWLPLEAVLTIVVIVVAFVIHRVVHQASSAASSSRSRP